MGLPAAGSAGIEVPVAFFGVMPGGTRSVSSPGFLPRTDSGVGTFDAGCAAVVLWALATLFRYRASLRRDRLSAVSLARTGVEHYRQELRRRRDHLRGAWIWHGPLVLACITSAVALSGRIVPRRIWDALPIMLALVVWAGFGIRRRFRQAAELQKEIDRKEEPL